MKRSFPLKILAVVGTRPEAVKMAPLIRRLKEDPRRFRVRLCATAQHRALLDEMLRVFGLRPDADLDIMRAGQGLSHVLERVLSGLDRLLAESPPDLVLAQGDTTTVLGAALAAFHRRVAVGHVEAGLRSFDKWRPFPEEKNRALVDQVSDLLFAPTALSKKNLLAEGIPASSIFVTGNTVVDSLRWAAAQPHRFQERGLKSLPEGAPLAVVTLHRRESFGGPLRGIFRGLREAAGRLPGFTWVYPVHPNPQVQGPARELLSHPRIKLVPPLGYLDFVHLMKRSRFIVTDSGGVQEEAPSLGKPVLVVREKTERPEALGAGPARLVGVSPERLVREILRLARANGAAREIVNPFGDGRAAERIVRAILHWAGRGPRPRDFRPG